MINIAKKKLPSPILPIIVYISYCAAFWFSTRGDIAYYGYQMRMSGVISYDAVAFFIGGLVPLALYLAISSFLFRNIAFRCGGDVKSVQYGLHFAVIASNLVLFVLKFIYIAAPLSSVMLEILLDPIITLGFVALYMWYAFKMEYVDKSRFRLVLSQVLGAFLALYGLLAAVGLMTSAV